jgi:homogentisate 1,2-dioxygenase
MNSQKLVRNFSVVDDENPKTECIATPNQLRWSPLPIPSEKLNFVESMATYCGAGNPSTRNGLAVHMYACNSDMTNTAFYNSDGDYLIVPQSGALNVQTELGFLYVAPTEILVIPVRNY